MKEKTFFIMFKRLLWKKKNQLFWWQESVGTYKTHYQLYKSKKAMPSANTVSKLYENWTHTSLIVF